MGNALKSPRVAKVEGDLKWTILACDHPLWVYMHSDNTLESRSRGWYVTRKRMSVSNQFALSYLLTSCKMTCRSQDLEDVFQISSLYLILGS